MTPGNRVMNRCWKAATPLSQAPRCRERGRIWAMHTTSLFNDYAVLARCGLFDAAYYQLRNSDISAHTDPLLHYLERGATERRDPGPNFDTAYYLEQCRRLGELPDNPLLHYLTIGVARGLEPKPGARDQRLRLAVDTPAL